jgi:hypothetical protein
MGVGTVQVESDNNMADYRIRRVDHIVEHVLPIFDKYPLLTSKYYNYDLFKSAALILNNPTLSTGEKHKLLMALKYPTVSSLHPSAIPTGFISPA